MSGARNETQTMNTKVEHGHYKQPEQPMTATLIVKYLTPTTMPLPRWIELFPALQISLGVDAPHRQELSVRGLDAVRWSQFLVDVWRVLLDDLEWAELSIASQCFRVLGGGQSPQIGPCPNHEEHSRPQP